MRKRKLEITLEKLDDRKEPDVREEQYSTPAVVAAGLLHFAYMNKDIEHCDVYDLGCGNGILIIGAKLLGAKKAVGIEKDEDLIEIARENSKKMGVEVDFKCYDVRELKAKADTIVMNPPFGAQLGNRHADRIFLEKAFEIAKVVYSIHRACSDSEIFIKKFSTNHWNGEITHRFSMIFPMKNTFWFHKKDKKFIDVDIYRIVNYRRRGQ